MRYRYIDISRYSTIGIGGMARLYYPTVDELNMVDNAHLLGNCSNTLVSDLHSHTLYTLNHLRGYEVDEGVVKVMAGHSLSKLSLDLSRLGYSGLEWAVGIPGSVGGGIYMNAGAFASDISTVLIGADIYRDGEIGYYPLSSLGLGYRTSDVQGIVVRGYFRLHKDEPSSILDKIDRYRQIRISTQPRERSLGSTFKRVDVVSAGRIIDEAGLKGFRIGDAMVSTLHAGFVVNVGEATYLDVRRLIDTIKLKVERYSGIILKEEIKYID